MLLIATTATASVSKATGGVTTNFAWDSDGSIPLLLSDGTNSYLYGPDGLPIERISTAGVRSYLHHDQLGDTTMLTSGTGARVATYTYDSYGLIKSKTGTATTPLLFAGQYQDAESGLYYLRARYYDPSTGQFMSVDPALSLAGQPYSYAGDDPVNGVNATGNSWNGVCDASGCRFTSESPDTVESSNSGNGDSASQTGLRS